MSAVMTREDATEIATRDSGSLMSIIQRASEAPNFDVDKLQKLLEVKERWDANEARKAFTAAMASFKANPPEILKDKHVSYTKKDGSVTAYDHATLGAICAAIIKGLSQHGISHHWDVAQSEGRIKVTCILTHEQGHSDSVSLNSAADDSGGKNSIQAIGSAVTYLQRYTLFAATGLAAMDQDDDGKDTGTEFITDSQALDLQAKAEEVGVNKANFLKFLKVSCLAELPASKYKAAIQALNDKASGAR